MTVRVLILHEERLLREALRALLDGRDEIHVVADAGDPGAAASLIEETRPDVVVVDLAFSDGALPAGRRPPVVAVVAEADRARALGNGAAAVVSRQHGRDEILAAIRAATGSRVSVLDVRGAHDPLRDLTAREREIFQLVIRGLSTAAIARRLDVSPRTIETHRAHLSRKLGAHSAADLVRYAARNGLLTMQAC